MPRCEIWWLEGRTEEQRNAIAGKLTESFMEVLKCPKEEVIVIFRETPPNMYYTAGTSTSQKRMAKEVKQNTPDAITTLEKE